MTLFEILYAIFIGPLQLIFEIIFSAAYRMIGHPGLAVVTLSLIMNVLILPLYRRSDAMQERARDTEEKLREGVTHIKKIFSGDERMMILQTYYRQNNYKPTNALQGSVSLLLEIPFFMAAYNFLSNVNALQGASLGPIMNLGVPDALITVGDICINLLPILMTLINVVSSAIYLKGFPLKTKIQLYGMAVFFLIFLYNSPSGLVFYWILNNLFSLGKNIVYKVSEKLLKGKIAVGEKKQNIKGKIKEDDDGKMFFLGSLALVILIGILIPSALIESATLQFVSAYFYNPLWYIMNTFCMAAGTFLVWMRVFYWLANEKGKDLFDKAVWILCGVAIINYMFFGTELGIMTVNLQYENGLSFERSEKFFNIILLIVIAIILYIVILKRKKLVNTILITIAIAIGGMAAYNVVDIWKEVEEVKGRLGTLGDDKIEIPLSREGKNVIVLMLDRAMGEYIPYLFNEKPELKEQFAGFTYYANTLSHGSFTNFGTPGLFGGYEYTPIEMNKRDSEGLVQKHNEALRVMPVLFSQNKFNVTVCDPPYANYSDYPDLRIYDDYPEISKYIMMDRYVDENNQQYKLLRNRRNLFCYSIMKAIPLFMQEVVYDGGNYNRVEQKGMESIYLGQKNHSNTTAEGIDDRFMSAYNTLAYLPEMTVVSKENQNTFIMMSSEITHLPHLLQEPDYVPMQMVDNTEYDKQNMQRFIYNDVGLRMETDQQVKHYHVNMATLLQLGKWFDYMREKDVYDNTRIILVADHGRGLYHIDDYTLMHNEEDTIEYYYPLLMVKDFNSTDLVYSEEFMTNADVPTLATDGVIEDPINPFTGKKIENISWKKQEQYVTMSRKYQVASNCGTTFLPSTWYAVKDDMRDKNNWRFIDEETDMPSELLDN